MPATRAKAVQCSGNSCKNVCWASANPQSRVGMGTDSAYLGSKYKVLSPKSKNQIQTYQNPKPQSKIRNHQRIDTTKSQTLNAKSEIQNDEDGPNELPLDMGNFVTVRKLSGARFPLKKCKSNLCESVFILCLAQLRWNMRSLTLLISMAL